MNNLTTDEIITLNNLLNKIQSTVNNYDTDYLYKHSVTKIVDKCFAISKLFKNKHINKQQEEFRWYMCKK